MEGAKLQEFKFEKVLNFKSEGRIAYLLGTIREEPAIVKLEKTQFQEDLFKNPHFILRSDQYFHNDIFRKFWAHLEEEASKVQADLIYPATPALIQKYTEGQAYLIVETAAIYEKYTKRYIEGADPAHI